MKWQHFRDPNTGETWMEPVSEPADHDPPALSPERQAELDDLVARTNKLTDDIKAALADINVKKETNADA